MANNLTLKVMANIAGKCGYTPLPAADESCTHANAHLAENEEKLILRAMARNPKQSPSCKGLAPRGNGRIPGAMISLDELALQKK